MILEFSLTFLLMAVVYAKSTEQILRGYWTLFPDTNEPDVIDQLAREYNFVIVYQSKYPYYGELRWAYSIQFHFTEWYDLDRLLEKKSALFEDSRVRFLSYDCFDLANEDPDTIVEECDLVLSPDDIPTAVVHDLSIGFYDRLGRYGETWMLVLDLTKLKNESEAEDLVGQLAHENCFWVSGAPSSTLFALRSNFNCLSRSTDYAKSKAELLERIRSAVESFGRDNVQVVFRH